MLERHERDMKIKKIVRVFSYFAIILIVVMLIIIISRTGERLNSDPKDNSSRIEKVIHQRT